jgi:hypothetical protein
MQLLRYFADLRPGKIALWCYLIWYLVTVANLFEPLLSLWLNSAGISAVIGIALKLSVAGGGGGKAARWQTFRLFAMPFCVSSFSALIKGRGFVLVFPSDVRLLTQCIVSCVVFLLACTLLRWVLKLKTLPSGTASGA